MAYVDPPSLEGPDTKIRLDVLHNIYDPQQSIRYLVRDVEVLLHNQSLNEVMQNEHRKKRGGYEQAWTQPLRRIRVFLYNNSHSLQLEIAANRFEKEGLSGSVVPSESFRAYVNTIV